jgi:hypothetical protein
MAARTASVRAVEIVRGNDAAFPGEVAATITKIALVHIENGEASTVAGGTDTLDCDLSAAISGKVRGGIGSTVTIRSACVVRPAYVNSTAYAATSSLSTNTVSLTPKQSDWSTNATLPANTTKTDRCFVVAVGYTEA